MAFKKKKPRLRHLVGAKPSARLSDETCFWFREQQRLNANDHDKSHAFLWMRTFHPAQYFRLVPCRAVPFVFRVILPWLSALLIGGQSSLPLRRLKDVAVVCVAAGRWGIRKPRVSAICSSPARSLILLKHGYNSLIRLWPALPTETCEPTAEFTMSSPAPTCTRTSICLLRLHFSPVSSHPLLFKNTTLCSLNVNYISVSFIRLCTLCLPPSFLHSLSLSLSLDALIAGHDYLYAATPKKMPGDPYLFPVPFQI